jgi:2'-5' RNA ligase
MEDFRFGTLVFLPSGDLRQTGDLLRERFDPVSAKTCAAHITLTQPFRATPNEERLAALIAGFKRFEATAGPFVSSPNQKLLWLDIQPAPNILALRDRLHETEMFRTDLPLTRGFIPHLTLSEEPREPAQVAQILTELNSKYPPWKFQFDTVSWIVPEGNFVFREVGRFELG